MINSPLPIQTLRRAKILRGELTEAEKKLWRRLRSIQVRGLGFRRRHPIPPCIVDSCCIEKKLIMELDGSQHIEVVDGPRTLYPKHQGWQVVGYWENDVLSRTESVLEEIWNLTE